MKRSVILVVLALLAMAAPALAAPMKALVGGRLIDGYGGAPIENSVVLIEGDRIQTVGRVGEVAIPEGAEVISTEGMSVLPGLWDMHVHLMIVGHADYAHWDKTYPPLFRSTIMPAAARQLLLAGVTSARDLGAPLEDSIAVREAIRKGEIPGPNLYVSGPFLQHEPYPGTEAFRWGIQGSADARAKVKRLADAGVDVIKLIDQDQMTMDEVRAVVDEAHKRNLPVVAHSHRAEEIRRGIQAGVDCFEHTGLGTAPEYPPDVFDLMKGRANTLFWTPTIGPLLLYEETRDAFPERLDDPRWQVGLPKEVVADIRQSLAHPDRLEYIPLRPLAPADAQAQVRAAPPVRGRPADRHGQRRAAQLPQRFDLAGDRHLGQRLRRAGYGRHPRRHLLARGCHEGREGGGHGDPGQEGGCHCRPRGRAAARGPAPGRRHRDQGGRAVQVTAAVTAARPRHTRLPLLYFGLAHVALGSAFAAMAFDPARFAGFFYHPRMIAVVHLVTLGWISASILGALYMIAPMALRARLPAGWPDFTAWAVYGIGVLGMVSHFWIDSPKGMVWSAGTVTVGLLWVAARAAVALWPAPVPGEVKIHFFLAFLNVLIAATLGVLLGLNKVEPVLGGFVMTNVYAHAHMAALGWATMMVMGAGYRLLPMLLPSAMPEGRPVALSAVLLEAGVLGLFASFLLRSRPPLLWVSALLVVSGLAAFLSRVVWMKRHPRPAPKALRRPDWGVFHAIQALLYLTASAGLGIALAFVDDPAWTLRAAPVYGTLGLVGFLAQIVVGVQQRLLPLYAWMRAYQGVVPEEQPLSPHETPVRPLQAAVFALWTVGVPLLAAGLGLERAPLLAAGSSVLLAAVVLGGFADLILFRRSRQPGLLSPRS